MGCLNTEVKTRFTDSMGWQGFENVFKHKRVNRGHDLSEVNKDQCLTHGFNFDFNSNLIYISATRFTERKVNWGFKSFRIILFFFSFENSYKESSQWNSWVRPPTMNKKKTIRWKSRDIILDSITGSVYNVVYSTLFSCTLFNVHCVSVFFYILFT